MNCFVILSNIWARLLSSCVKELDNKIVGNCSHCIEEASDRHAFSITIYLFILQRILTFALSLYKTILKSIGLVSAIFTFTNIENRSLVERSNYTEVTIS